MTVVSANSDIYAQLGLGGSEAEKRPSNDLQMQDFLDLMVTELTHQDPFKPMENSELGSQISQFATVSGIDKLNNSFSGLQSSLLSDQALQAANLVGREVLVPTSVGYLENGGSINGVVGLDASAANVTVRVSSSTGELIREISLGTQDKGEVNFSWDGFDDAGAAVPPGKYQITAHASVDGESTNPYTLMAASVESVSIGAPGQPLALNLLGLGTISFSDVAEIH